MEEVAKAALMSVAHFERTFKACTGMTPHDYYIKTKVNRLKEALLNQNKGVEQAFSECGLPYHGYYAQLFKRETGLTPSEYRKIAQTQTRPINKP